MPEATRKTGRHAGPAGYDAARGAATVPRSLEVTSTSCNDEGAYGRGAHESVVVIPTDDEVAESQGLDCPPHGIVPDDSPVFSKPIVTLRGMGTGGQIVSSKAEFERVQQSGRSVNPTNYRTTVRRCVSDVLPAVRRKM